MPEQNYNDDPVFYCTNCLSLSVKEFALGSGEPVILDICQECGNSDIDQCHIEQWNKLYVEQYGQLFLLEDFDSIVE